MTPTKTITDVYRERNLLATALAIGFHRERADAGWHYPPGGDWPVVWVQLPIGGTYRQVGYHVPPTDRPLLDASSLPNRPPPGGYDDHDRTDRLNRVTKYIEPYP
jgi:hypothetical protein